MSSRRKVLLILDDVYKQDQLEALAGKHNWFGNGSRIIITTRDEHLLRAHKVDHVYPIRLLIDDEAVQLFKRHTYNEEDPIEDYETLSLRVISYASGLPLALKVIGSFLCDKNKNQWISALDNPDDAMEIFEACAGYNPEIEIKVLRQKALITIVKKEWGGNKFDMHDLVQEMGHYIVRGEHPKNPRKHSRVWKDEEIEAMCFDLATMENYETEALKYFSYYDLDNNYISSRICEIMSSMKKLRWIDVTFGDDNGDGRPTNFSDSFHPKELCFLKLRSGKQKKLWDGYKHLPHLKVLHLEGMNFSISQLTCLKVLNLSHCKNLIELPDPPSSLVFLNARHWIPLTTNIVNGGERLLQSMLEGDAIKNRSMILIPPGFKIPMGFTPPLLKVRRYTLQLPENWQDYFSGFLMCVVLNDAIISRDDFKIIVKQALSFEDDLVWEESDGKWYTLVWYVSFDLLRDTARWNQTYKALSFEITKGECSGFGVRLVAKKNRSGLMETSTTNSYDYTPLFKIEYDKASDAIMISSLFDYY
ncbi:hypothetical protein E3N88_22766 [Mikania micrantha]|uniref:Uncharacterized protein n=1 Tax=Mikania micrantha TaxID=192012 RepID=A0A5N6NE18_9ASTR|nr:hypothetical protein E3N88_22766 [Mikania micrantha]